jgi:hypothetical protein
MTTPNNAILWNASLEGYLAGQLSNRRITAKNTGTPPAIGTPDASYATLAAEGTPWAAAMDAATPNDHAGNAQPTGTIPISVVTTGVAIVPSTDASGDTEFAQVCKARGLAACALAVFESRYYAQVLPAPLTQAEFATLTAVVEAMYDEIVTDDVTSGRSLGTGHSFLVQFAVLAGGLAGILAKTQKFAADTTFAEALEFPASLGFAVDALIANGVTVGNGPVAINQGSGYPVAPTTGPNQEAVLGAFRLLYSITLAYFETRPTGQLLGSVVGAPAILAWGTANAPPIAAVFNAAQGSLVTVVGGSSLNPLLYNEAFCAFIAANLAGRPFTSASPTDANYVAVVAAATAFATAVDTAIGASDNLAAAVPTGTTPINAEGNETAVPSLGPTQEAQLGKTGILWGICRGTMRGRPLLGNALDATSSTYTNVANAIAALYLEMASVCLNTPSP